MQVTGRLRLRLGAGGGPGLTDHRPHFRPRATPETKGPSLSLLFSCSAYCHHHQPSIHLIATSSGLSYLAYITTKMRLVKRHIDSDGSGSVTLCPEEPEDMVSHTSSITQ